MEFCQLAKPAAGEWEKQCRRVQVGQSKYGVDMCMYGYEPWYTKVICKCNVTRAWVSGDGYDQKQHDIFARWNYNVLIECELTPCCCCQYRHLANVKNVIWKNEIVFRNEVLLCNSVDPVTLTFDLWTPKQYHFDGSQSHSLYTKFEHFGIFVFLFMLRTNRQTDRQTDGL